MKNFRRTALASVINLALAGVSDVYAATDAKDTAALERRIRELERLGYAGALRCISNLDMQF
jgi:phosphate-selective porin OprO/OprP